MPNPRTKTRFPRSLIRWLLVGLVLLWSLAALILVATRWIDPPTTAVHFQRRLQAWIHHSPYRERYKFIPLSQISPDLQHAVIAAEDAHFYQHHGFDCREIQVAVEEDLDFHHNAATRPKPILRNGALDPPPGRRGQPGAGGRIRTRQTAQSGDIPKRGRMGPGIYGAESACRHYDETADAGHQSTTVC